jgi:hypothetical protein
MEVAFRRALVNLSEVLTRTLVATEGMAPTDSKCEASVWFVCDRLRKAVSGPHAATVHLFTHEYDPTTFWYGVAFVGCTVAAITNDAKAAGAVELPPDAECNLQSFSLAIGLEGRWGKATCLRWDDEFGPAAEDHLRIDFIGMGPLIAGAPQ